MHEKKNEHKVEKVLLLITFFTNTILTKTKSTKAKTQNKSKSKNSKQKTSMNIVWRRSKQPTKKTKRTPTNKPPAKQPKQTSQLCKGRQSIAKQTSKQEGKQAGRQPTIQPNKRQVVVEAAGSSFSCEFFIFDIFVGWAGWLLVFHSLLLLVLPEVDVIPCAAPGLRSTE